jgi:hypothetical protein
MDTLEQLYWIALIALVILGPIGFLLWRRTTRQLMLADGMPTTADRTPAAEQPALAQEFQTQQPTAGGARKAIKLAPLEEVVRQLLQKAPHIGVIGKTGDGKTTTGEAIIRLLQGEAFVADPKWWRGKWGGLAAAGIDDDAGYGQIATGLKDVFSEFNRRRIYKRDNPEATFTDLWLIWDEINDTMEEVPDAGIPLRRLLRVGREYNVHVLFFPQSDRVGALGLEGHGDAVDNVLWVYLGADARKVVNRLARDKKIDAATEQQLLALPRPAVVGHGGQFYAVDLTNAVPLSQGPLTTLASWTVPVPSSEGEKIAESTLGTPELPAAKPSPKLPELREAAVRYWIAQGLKDTPIAMKLDMRKADALEYVRELRAKLVQEEQQNVLQELIEQPLAA